MAALIPGYDNVEGNNNSTYEWCWRFFARYLLHRRRGWRVVYIVKLLKIAIMCVALGGRVAEELIYGEDEITTGDLEIYKV